MKKLNSQRFALALVSAGGLILAGIGVFVLLGLKVTIDAVAAGMLTLLVRELGGGKAAAFAWFFEGAADKPPPETGTSTTTESKVVEPEKARPAGTPADPLSTQEVRPPTA